MASASTITSSTPSIVNPSVGIILSSSTALIASIASLITNLCESKFQKSYTKLRGCINVITLLHGKASKQSMVKKKVVENEANKVEEIFDAYLNKRKETMKNTDFKVEDIFLI